MSDIRDVGPISAIRQRVSALLQANDDVEWPRAAIVAELGINARLVSNALRYWQRRGIVEALLSNEDGLPVWVWTGPTWETEYDEPPPDDGPACPIQVWVFDRAGGDWTMRGPLRPKETTDERTS